MIERGHRDIRPFGTRRPAEPSEARTPEPIVGIPGWDAPKRPPGPLPWALRTAVIAGLAGLLVTQYLARQTGPGDAATARMARGPAFQADPETTGSIGGGVRSTRLDPCTAATDARPRR